MQTEAKVGIAVILGAAMLVLMLGKVERWTRADQVGTQLLTRFDTVAGLELKSPVQVAGVTVGEVTDIHLAENQAEVAITLLPGVTIYKDAEATIKSTGLLGEKYLELIPGAPGNGSYGNGELVPQRPGSGDLDRLVSQLNAVAVDIRAVAAAMREILASETGKARINSILDNTRGFTAALNRRGPEIMARVDAILAKIEGGEGTVGKLVNNDAVYDDLEQTMATVRDVVEQINKGQGTLGKLVKDPALYERLEGAAAGVEQITAKVASGEGTLGRLLTDDTTVDAFNSAMVSMGEMGDRLNRLRTFISFRNEFQFNTSDNKGYFSLRLDPGSKRAYVIEIVSDPSGKVRRNTSRNTVNGVTTTTESLNTNRSLLFTGLFDQRFGDWGLRGGLMESTFGFGVDYDGWERAQVFLDAWDFDSQRDFSDQPHMKATIRVQPKGFFFFQAGYDNFLNSRLDSPFLGAGLTFEDEDIKYLLGAAASALN